MEHQKGSKINNQKKEIGMFLRVLRHFEFINLLYICNNLLEKIGATSEQNFEINHLLVPEKKAPSLLSNPELISYIAIFINSMKKKLKIERCSHKKI